MSTATQGLVVSDCDASKYTNTGLVVILHGSDLPFMLGINDNAGLQLVP